MRAVATLIIGLLVMSAWTTEAFGALETRRERCSSLFLNFHYDTLKLDEPAIGKAFEKMVLRSGGTNVTNCVVEFPVQDGRATFGPRRVVLDKQWYTIVKYNGLEKEELQHHGIEIQYDLKPGETGTIREVTALTVCRTPKACEAMRIPFFRNDKKKVTTPGKTPNT